MLTTSHTLAAQSYQSYQSTCSYQLLAHQDTLKVDTTSRQVPSRFTPPPGLMFQPLRGPLQLLFQPASTTVFPALRALQPLTTFPTPPHYYKHSPGHNQHRRLCQGPCHSAPMAQIPGHSKFTSFTTFYFFGSYIFLVIFVSNNQSAFCPFYIFPAFGQTSSFLASQCKYLLLLGHVTTLRTVYIPMSYMNQFL
jgi:hypothetical protein